MSRSSLFHWWKVGVIALAVLLLAAAVVTRPAEETQTALVSLHPQPGAYDGVALSAVAFPPFAPLFSRQYLDLFAALQALRILEAAPELRQESFRVSTDKAFVLTAAEQTQLRDMKHTKLHSRVADLEEEVFGKVRA